MKGGRVSPCACDPEKHTQYNLAGISQSFGECNVSSGQFYQATIKLAPFFDLFLPNVRVGPTHSLWHLLIRSVNVWQSPRPRYEQNLLFVPVGLNTTSSTDTAQGLSWCQLG